MYLMCMNQILFDKGDQRDLEHGKKARKTIAHREGRTRSLQITAGITPALKV